MIASTAMILTAAPQLLHSPPEPRLILQAFEKRIKSEGMPSTEAGVLSLLEIDIREYDEPKPVPPAAQDPLTITDEDLPRELF